MFVTTITGPTGSGKSTIAHALYERYGSTGRKAVIIDENTVNGRALVKSAIEASIDEMVLIGSQIDLLHHVYTLTGKWPQTRSIALGASPVLGS